MTLITFEAITGTGPVYAFCLKKNKPAQTIKVHKYLEATIRSQHINAGSLERVFLRKYQFPMIVTACVE